MWLNVVLWLAQVALAAMFGFAGFMKVATPLATLAQNPDAAWIKDMGPLVRFIGVTELLGAVGVVLPALTRILPRLTPLAALGIALIMALATVFHLFRAEFPFIVPTIVLGALAVFVAWGRSKAVPIAPR
jgi:uncharacterized membrane protein YphA (DoxX/SURF4 family)